MNIKAIVMDMDGTLLNSKDKISPKTKDALEGCFNRMSKKWN